MNPIPNYCCRSRSQTPVWERTPGNFVFSRETEFQNRRSQTGFRERGLLFLFCFLIFVSRVLSSPSERVPIIQKAPDFDLIDQSGKKVCLADYKGKVFLVSFIFTTCSGSCPATTSRMAKIQEHLQ